MGKRSLGRSNPLTTWEIKFLKAIRDQKLIKDWMSGDTQNKRGKNTCVREFSPCRALALCVASTNSRISFLRIYFRGHSESLWEEPWGVWAQRVETQHQKWPSPSAVPPSSVGSMPPPCTAFANPTLLSSHQSHSKIWIETHLLTSRAVQSRWWHLELETADTHNPIPPGIRKSRWSSRGYRAALCPWHDAG